MTHQQSHFHTLNKLNFLVIRSEEDNCDLFQEYLKASAIQNHRKAIKEDNVNFLNFVFMVNVTIYLLD